MTNPTRRDDEMISRGDALHALDAIYVEYQITHGSIYSAFHMALSAIPAANPAQGGELAGYVYVPNLKADFAEEGESQIRSTPPDDEPVITKDYAPVFFASSSPAAPAAVAQETHPCDSGCQYSKDIGMFQAHSCGNGCMYDKAAVALDIGSRWQHTNGNFYTVLLIANHASTRDKYPVTVVYQGDNGNVWSRRLSDWHRSMTFVALAAPAVAREVDGMVSIAKVREAMVTQVSTWQGKGNARIVEIACDRILAAISPPSPLGGGGES